MMITLLSIICVVYIWLNVGVYANTNICTNSTILSGIALNCTSPVFITLATQPTTELKCNVVMNSILPCIIARVNSTYATTCTAKEQNDLILTFRQDIKDYIGFDVLDCLPARSCATVASMLYYLPVYCNTDYEQFVTTGDCSKMRDALRCLRLNFNTTENGTCTDRAVYTTTVNNMADWPHQICPACEPLEGYYCGLGPVVQTCPSNYYCNVHPADAFAVCCPNDPDSTASSITATPTTTAPTTTHITTPGLPARSCSTVESMLYYLPMYCNSDYQLFVSSGNCSKLLDSLHCLQLNFNTTENGTCTGLAVYRTTVYNMGAWPYDICPACVPLADYFCGRGPNRQNCPTGFYCNIHPADGFAVCCPEDPDITSTTTTTQATTFGDTGHATSVHISFQTALTLFIFTSFVLVL